MSTNPLSWEVVEYQGNSTEPHSIKRLSDQIIFKIGDVVTNGTKMKGKITKFNFSFKEHEVYVNTTWSGIGMNLDSLNHVSELPSKFQKNDVVVFVLHFGLGIKVPALIIAVHFFQNQVKYDLEIEINNNYDTSRIYNVSEKLIIEK